MSQRGFTMQFLRFLAAAAFAFTTSSVANAETIAHSLTFEFDGAGKPQIRELSVAGDWHIRPNHPFGNPDFMYGSPNGTRPPGVSTHAMSFRFKSNGYFSSHPEDSDHLAIMLKGQWYRLPLGSPTSGFLQGRGAIILGNSPSRLDTVNPSSTFQTWDYSDPSGGKIWRTNFLSGPLDNTWYTFTMHVNSVGRGYDIRDETGKIVTAQTIIDTTFPSISDDLGGWFIIATNNSYATYTTKPNWTIEFSDLQVWWF